MYYSWRMQVSVRNLVYPKFSYILVRLTLYISSMQFSILTPPNKLELLTVESWKFRYKIVLEKTNVNFEAELTCHSNRTGTFMTASRRQQESLISLDQHLQSTSWWNYMNQCYLVFVYLPFRPSSSNKDMHTIILYFFISKSKTLGWLLI